MESATVHFFLRLILSIVLLMGLFIGLGALSEPDVFLGQTRWFFSDVKKEEGDIRDVIYLYNDILSDLYASDGKTMTLNDFPGVKRLRHEIYRDIDFLRNRKLILVYDKADLIIINVRRPSPQTAEVITFEEWNYLYQKASTREPVQDIKGMEQGFKYFLRKQNSTWAVVDYAPMAVKPSKNRDEFYF